MKRHWLLFTILFFPIFEIVFGTTTSRPVRSFLTISIPNELEKEYDQEEDLLMTPRPVDTDTDILLQTKTEDDFISDRPKTLGKLVKSSSTGSLNSQSTNRSQTGRHKKISRSSSMSSLKPHSKKTENHTQADNYETLGTKKTFNPDETGSVWSISDLESVATHMPEPPSNQTQKNPSSSSSESSSDTQNKQNSDETGSVWSISDLESVATHMPEPPSNQTQKNPSSTSAKSSTDAQNKQNPDETGSILSMSDLESVASRIPTSSQTQKNPSSTSSKSSSDTQNKQNPDETGSVWSMSDLESVATHMPEPPSNQTQKNPSSSSSESSSDTQNKQNPDKSNSTEEDEQKSILSGLTEAESVTSEATNTSKTSEISESSEDSSRSSEVSEKSTLSELSEISEVSELSETSEISEHELPYNKNRQTSIQVSSNNYYEICDQDLSEIEIIFFKGMFADQINQILKKCKENRLKELYINGLDPYASRADLAEFPSEIRRFTNLEVLHFSHSKLSSVPQWLNELVNIQSLEVKNSELKEFPTIRKLKQLNRLSLDGNKISVIPDWIDDLKELFHLDLSNNNIHKLPKNVAKLKNLRYLLMLSNELDELPEQIKSLAPSDSGKLEEINIVKNKFMKYPPVLKTLEDAGVYVVVDPELIKTDNNLLIQDILNKQNLDYEYLINQDFSQLTVLNINCKNLTSEQLINILDKLDPKKLVELGLFEVEVIPDILEQFTNLQKLRIEHSSLEEFPEFVSKMINLQEIHFAHNIIKNIPSWINTLKKLQVLDLYNNSLKNLYTLEQISKIRILNIGGNRFFTFPSEILRMNQLEELYMRNVHLRSLPEEISELKKLQVLDIYDNSLSNLPAGLKKLVKLRTLNFGMNKFRAIPKVVSDLKNLEGLYIRNVRGNLLNHVEKKNYEKKDIQGLEIREKKGNLETKPIKTNEYYIRNKTPIIIDCSVICKLSHLRYLDLSCNHLGEISKNIVNLKELRKLNLSECVFKGIETIFPHFERLEELNLSGAQWELGTYKLKGWKSFEIYKPHHTILAIQCSKSLRFLDISGLKWTGYYTKYEKPGKVKDNLYQMPKNLEVLKLENCDLSEFPKILEYSPNLLELSLANNIIGKLPKDMKHLATLHNLDISGNRIETLSNSIIDLTYLRKLNLSDNLLTELPNEMEKLSNLQYLDISQNDLQDPPYGLINRLKSLEELNVRFNDFSFDPTKIKLYLKKLCYKSDSDSLTVKLSEYKQKKSMERILKNTLDLRIVSDIQDTVKSGTSIDKYTNAVITHYDTQRVGSAIEEILKQCNPDILEKLEISHCSYLKNYTYVHTILSLISKFHNLKNLNLSYSDCDWKNSDNYISNFTNLKTLDLTGNSLSELPKWIGNLTELEELYLANNTIHILPSWVENLKQLKILSLDNNKLADLNASIWNLSNLQYLSLNGNRLDRLAPQVGQLSNLQTLLISGNELTDLPTELMNLINIKRLAILDNQFGSNRPSILNELIRKGVHVETDTKDIETQQEEEQEEQKETTTDEQSN